MVKACRLNAVHTPLQPVGFDVGHSHVHGNLINVARQHRLRPDPRGTHAQNRCATADIRHVLASKALARQTVQRLQASQSRPVVPRTKSHSRLDQQRLASFGHLVRIVTAINKEPPRLDRHQLALDLGHPIGVRQFRDRERFRAKGRCQNRQPGVIRRLGEIAANFPKARAVFHLKRAHTGRLRVKALEGCAQLFGVFSSG